jgi:hypothetical protein
MGFNSTRSYFEKKRALQRIGCGPQVRLLQTPSNPRWRLTIGWIPGLVLGWVSPDDPLAGGKAVLHEGGPLKAGDSGPWCC